MKIAPEWTIDDVIPVNRLYYIEATAAEKATAGTSVWVYGIDDGMELFDGTARSYISYASRTYKLYEAQSGMQKSHELAKRNPLPGGTPAYAYGTDNEYTKLVSATNGSDVSYTTAAQGKPGRQIAGGSGATADTDQNCYYLYDRARYTLSFNLGSASGTLTSQSVYYGEGLQPYTPRSVGYTGHTFGGWYLQDPGDFPSYNTAAQPFDFDADPEPTMPAGNLTLYAKWIPNDLNVNFYDDLGLPRTLMGTKTTGKGGTIDEPGYLTPGVGYPGKGQFLYWARIIPSLALGDIPLPFVFEGAANPTKVTASTDLYAMWKTAGLKVTYDKGDGSGLPPADTKSYALNENARVLSGAGITAPLGKVFYGWKAGSEEVYPYNLHKMLADTTLTAWFEPSSDSMKITYYPVITDASLPMYETWQAKNKLAHPLAGEVFTHPGKDLVGWANSPEKAQAAGAVEQVLAGTPDPGYYKLGASFPTGAGDETFYAIWRTQVKIEIAASAKVYGDPDSTLRATVLIYDTGTNAWVDSSMNLGGIGVTALPPYTREAGENVGTYDVSVSVKGVTPQYRVINPALLGDSITFKDVFSITKRPLTVTIGTDSKPWTGSPVTSNLSVAVSAGALGWTGPGLPAGVTADILLPLKVVASRTAVGTTTYGGGSADVPVAFTIKSGGPNPDRDMTANYNITIANGSLTVTKADVTVITKSATRTYDGTPLTDANYTVTGLPSGYTAMLTTTGAQTAVGSSKNTYTNLVITRDADGVDVTASFTVTPSLGDLTVTKTDVTATTESATKTYNGTPLAGTGYNVTGLPAGHTAVLTTTGTQTEVGTSKNTYKDLVITRDADGADVTNQFTVTDNLGDLVVVNSTGVTVITNSATKTYNGTPLTAAGYNVIGLPTGHTATLTTTGTQTEVGTSKNTYKDLVITRDADGVDVTTSFYVTASLGDLAVIKTGVTVITNSATKTYDGTPLTDSSYNVIGLPAGHTAALDITGTQTAASSSTNTYKDLVITRIADGVDVTDSFAVTDSLGDLTVTKADVTVITNGAAKTYDGTPLTAASYTVIGLPAGHTAALTTTGSRTEVGNADNTYKDLLIKDAGGNDVNSSFTVTDNIGKLIVTAKDIIIKPVDRSKDYDGTALVPNAWEVVGTLPADVTVIGSATYRGSQTDVGTSDSFIDAGTLTLGGAKAGNYTLVLDSGTLTVNPKAVIPGPFYVTYDPRGGDSNGIADTKGYMQGETVVVILDREPVLSGYVFAGWDTSLTATTPMYPAGGASSFVISSDTTLYAIWIPRTDMPYIVQHWFTDEDGNVVGTVPAVTEHLTGTTGAMVTAAEWTSFPSNYVYDPLHLGTVRSGTVAADGSLVLRLYYRDNSTPPPPPIVPPGPEIPTPVTPVAPVTPVVAIPEETVPLAPAPAPTPVPDSVVTPSSVDTTIADTPTPTRAGDATWALLNLILTALGALLFLVMLVLFFVNRKREEEADNRGGQRTNERTAEKAAETRRKRFVWRLMIGVAFVVALIVFLLTEDITLPMAWVDWWTIVHVVILLIQIIFAALAANKKKESGSARHGSGSQSALGAR
ncbi:MAG: InlB B-repeat-containing protein [Coriobacteriales bacterium]|nr:InlB B-repeat-containing protein [Coriobacteriales bacterium]